MTAPTRRTVLAGMHRSLYRQVGWFKFELGHDVGPRHGHFDGKRGQAVRLNLGNVRLDVLDAQDNEDRPVLERATTAARRRCESLRMRRK